MAAITYGTAKIEGEASFRIPFGLFFIIPFIVGCCAFFLSEVSIAKISSMMLLRDL